MSNTTITLQNVLNFASTHADLVPLTGVGGYTNEPGLSICNDALSDLLTSPNDWKFNSKFMGGLVTATNKQDYIFAGASAFTMGATSTGVGIGLASNSAITESGNTVTVITLEAHRMNVGDTVFMHDNTVAAYNSTYTDNGVTATWTGGWVITAVPTPTSFTFTHALSGLANSGAAGITDLGWVSDASMYELNNNCSPPNIYQLDVKKDLPVWSKVATPTRVCIVQDNGDGTLKIRFYFVPGSTIFRVHLVYQAKAPLKIAVTDSWSPFPDHLSAVVRQAVMARMYRYLNSPQQVAEDAKLQREINKAQGFDDNEDTDVSIVPEDGSFDDGWFGIGGF